MLEKSMKLCSMYSYYRRNVCDKIERSKWKIVEVRNFTYCPLNDIEIYNIKAGKINCKRIEKLVWFVAESKNIIYSIVQRSPRWFTSSLLANWKNTNWGVLILTEFKNVQCLAKYTESFILGVATDCCRSRPSLACPPLHGASNCRCSQTLALFLVQFPSNCHAHRRTFAKRRHYRLLIVIIVRH